MKTKDAIEAAIAFLQEIYPDVSDFLVEEIELKGRLWKITLSFPSLNVKGAFANSLLGSPRTYKSLEIDTEKGTVISMKIRTVDSGV